MFEPSTGPPDLHLLGKIAVPDTAVDTLPTQTNLAADAGKIEKNHFRHGTPPSPGNAGVLMRALVLA